MYSLDAMRGLEETFSSTVHVTNNFDYPLKKNRQRKYKIQSGERIRVNMTSDTFIEEADVYRDGMWKIIKERSDVIFWLLTKRPERILECLPKDWGSGYDNVALNVTCENQEMFDQRIPIFRDIPAKHKGLCLAPLLGPIDISKALPILGMDEIFCGGENYNHPRICNCDWVRSIYNACVAYGVNFCFYETGTRFVIDGTEHFIPKKADQSALAYLLQLSCKFYDVKFDLRDPDTGRLLADDELYQKRYNKHHCTFCANRMVCNGCSTCGNCCGPVELVTLEELWACEDMLLAGQSLF